MGANSDHRQSGCVRYIPTNSVAFLFAGSTLRYHFSIACTAQPTLFGLIQFIILKISY